jgi:hypothetical protein
VRDLWWDEAFLHLNFRWESIVTESSVVLPFQILPGLVQVGFIGPYSLAFTPENPINRETINNVWSELLGKFEEFEMQVRLPPEIYYRDLFRANFRVLNDLGARVLYQDVNFHLDLKGDFRDSINRNRNRELKRGLSRNYVFEQIDLRDAYKVILANRLAKGLQPSLSEQQFVQLHELFTERLKFHGIKQEGKLVSASITLIVNPTLAYVFMWGHDPSEPTSGESISTLCENLFLTFKSEGYEYLCLGTASTLGVVDVGLSMYKSSLGAIESYRITMGKTRGIST